MITQCRAHIEFIDITAIEDAAVTVGDNVVFGNLTLLQGKDAVPCSTYATGELNQFILDGSRTIIDDTIKDVAYMSTGRSDEDCNYSGMGVDVRFQSRHTSAGIKLYFAYEYPAEVQITWYGMTGEVLDSIPFYPDRLQYFCKWQVENYTRVYIEFKASRHPDRCVRLQYIKYGNDITWERQEIIDGTLTEDMDPISATLSVNKAKLTILDSDSQFDARNHTGVWKSIQKEQELTITETINGTDHDYGTYYIDTWSSGDNKVTFNLIDRIGIMDKTNYYGGEVYTGKRAGEIIDAIMESAGVTDYIVEEDIAKILLTGHLAIQTHRAALQQVVFACRAVADCSRGSTIRIYRASRQVQHTIGANRKFSTKLTLKEYVSGVAITYKRYKLAAISDIYDDVLPGGITRIELTAPVQPVSITVSGGSLISAGYNYIIIRMKAKGACKITGQQYDSSDSRIRVDVPYIATGEIENVKEYSGCTLINAETAITVAEDILNYLQLRQSVNIKYLGEGEHVGAWCNVMDVNQRCSYTGITGMQISLAGGNIVTARSVGYSAVVTDIPYTGEIYASEPGMI